jgi:hypothetical protein
LYNHEHYGTSKLIYYRLQWPRGLRHELSSLRSRDSVVGIATGYGRVKNFLHVAQTGSRVHPTSYPMGTGGFSSGVKRPGHEADHSPQASAEVTKMWIDTSAPPYIFMA